MNKICILLFLLIFGNNVLQGQSTTGLQAGQDLQTPTYPEVIAWWQALAQTSPYVDLQEAGLTDSGEPLHLVLYSSNKEFSLDKLRQQGKCLLLINNGIHPGEPDGIDASMQLIKQLTQDKKLRKETENVVIALVPVYNIGGALNRNGFSRANQNGPEEYGFRGNARNLDLNRDFIKMDSRNALAFARLFLKVKPQLYIETHVSNGADYQYTMTLLSTQHNKLGGPLGKYLNQQLEPALYRAMEKKEQPMTPYVNVWGSVPDSGWVAFLDGPRYSSGYAALHHTVGLVTETHMLKPYPQRVKATYQFLLSALELMAGPEGRALKQAQQAQAAYLARQTSLPLSWQPDTTHYTPLKFKGYEARYQNSEVSGLPRLLYQRDKPFEKEVKYYNTFKPTTEKTVPTYYLIPQGWWPVLERLRTNGVHMKRIAQDTLIQAQQYRIVAYQTSNRAYEGHYPHYGVEVEAVNGPYTVRAGDYLIPTDQPARRFLVEVLEPQAPDSYFAWNFFDTILQQKEGFSAYVFEDVAAEWLQNNPELRAELNRATAEDKELAASGYAQLRWVYERTPYYEDAHLAYPVLRIP